jgi:hypothetical protein
MEIFHVKEIYSNILNGESFTNRVNFLWQIYYCFTFKVNINNFH